MSSGPSRRTVTLQRDRRSLLSRRTFLRGAGGAAVALPLLASRRAVAQSVPTWPKRFLVFYTPNGVKRDAWAPTPGPTETRFSLNRSHAALEPFSDRLILTAGINMVSSDDGPGSPHQRGMGTVLTGRPLLEGSFLGGDGSLAGWGSGISVDQRIAQVIGAESAFESLQLGARCMGGEVRMRICYRAAEQPLPPINDPTQVYDRLFATYEARPSELQRLRARRRSVLDAVLDQFAAVQRTVGSDDREKLEQHAELVRDVERRLARLNLPGDECSPPSAPPQLDFDSEQMMPAVTHLQIDLLVMGLACDLTRVASLQIGESENNLRYPWINSLTEGHSLSHAPPSDRAAHEEWVRRDTWHAEQLAYLLSRMDGIQEGSGTLLDNTVVLWVTDVAVGNTHSHANMPFLLAGGAGGALRTGRFVQFASVPHNRLLTTLLHAMDVPDPGFGRSDVDSSPLTTLLA